MLSQDERDPLPHSSPDYILKAYVYLNIHDKGVWYFNPYLFLPVTTCHRAGHVVRTQ